MEIIDDNNLYEDNTRLPINFSCGCTIIIKNDVKDVNYFEFEDEGDNVHKYNNNFKIHSFILCKKHMEIMLEELSEYALDPEIFLEMLSEQLSNKLKIALERKERKNGIGADEFMKF